MRVLQVAAEAHPLVKTGGLADVLGALPAALQALPGAVVDCRLLLPGWPAVMQGLRQLSLVTALGPCFGAAQVRLMRGHMPDSGLQVYVVDAPLLYGRAGNPYHDARGADWPDNLQRFGLLGWAAAQLAAPGLDPQWSPQLLHAHDWHAGMACAYLKAHACEVPCVFTVHNLAYQGLFPHQDSALLGLSSRFMSPAGLEFHGQLSFMKAGLKFGDAITTVSPTYAKEITTTAMGCGLDGVLRSRVSVLHGILNGIDNEAWNPQTDPVLTQHYSASNLSGKAACKAALQAEVGLSLEASTPVLLALSRMTSQKGLDLLLEALPQVLELGVQVVVQGAGDPVLESAFGKAAKSHPGRVAALIGYDESRAHRLLAGSDLLVMPSRFEPCGLTQLYALRYGTLPIVRATGGLADTIIDLDSALASRPESPGNGFTFEESTAGDLAKAIGRAVLTWQQPQRRRALQAVGMGQDFSWASSARQYLGLYGGLLPAAA